MINPVLLIVIPLLFAFLSVIFKKADKTLLLAAVAFNVFGALVIQEGNIIIGGWKPPFGINLVVDQYSIFGLMILNIAFALSVITSLASVKKYSTVLLVSLASLNGMMLTGDLFNLFVFLEIASISAYIMSTMTKSFKGTFNYIILGALGSNLYLLGIIILYATTGTLNMADMASKISFVNSNVLLLAVTFIFAGFAVETKIMPFNGWVKMVYGNVNDLNGGIFASAYATAAIMMFGRMFTNIFVVDGTLKTLLLTITALTFVFGEIAAFSQKNIRSILAFSSIGQAGLITTLFLTGITGGAMMQVANNAFAKLLMFTIAGAMYVYTGTDNIEKLQGLFKKHKLIGLGFSIAALSLVGLPLFYGFYVKIFTLTNLFKLNNFWIPALILFASLIEGIYFIRMLVKLWNPGEEGKESKDVYTTKLSLENSFAYAALAIAVGLFIIYISFNPEFITQGISNYLSNIPGGM
ncbi:MULTISPECIES: complex I subunit 5 family protein [unclassified Marinitoga]|uniref:complex I subunit 5 family protein n=1 Tax=unclassified Marinitoga TaxID=2640159 RepID=UPI00064176A5|nr:MULTISPECIES: proton-conducting transporter membrane subunit [unclassified Marinitoga]KLO24999.1 NADH-ubiquinone oxidoreductase [Marinitoga sp. 1155]NUU98727.1 NADH-ubiquinone oxidoreductase [Marinitoga sp. 1154]